MASAAESHQPIERDPSLTQRDLRILEFERQWQQNAGAKEDAIRRVFDLSAARYYQLLNTVIDSPDAVRLDPMLIKRLQRARDARVRTRAARAFTSSRQVDRAHRLLPDETTD